MTTKRSAAGFTLIELLIATAVFGVVLLVVTSGVLMFTRQYYKGVISANTQTAARSVIDEISRAIQLNGSGVVNLYSNGSGPASTDPVGYCVGSSRRYSFAQNSQVEDSGVNATEHQGYHGLIVDNISGCTSATQALNPVSLNPLPSGNDAHDLLGQHMRLVKLQINPVGGDAYNIKIKVAYGDDDLLCIPGSCSSSASLPANLAGQDLTCKNTRGSQFCAISELSITVNMRVK